MKRFVILLNKISTKCETQINFVSEKTAIDFIQISKLDGYKIYQYIQNDYTYNMPIDELEQEDISFIKLFRKKKSFFGLLKKNIIDILIEPKDGFFYPYSYGYYFYIFTKHYIEKTIFEDWLNRIFLTKNIEESFLEINSEFIDLMNEDDYLLVTNHDYQEYFGICGNENIINQIINKFKIINLSEFEIKEKIPTE